MNAIVKDGNTKIKFSLGIGVDNGVDSVFTVKELVPNWDSLSVSKLKDAIQEEFEEWKNERIDGAWESIQ